MEQKDNKGFLDGAKGVIGLISGYGAMTIVGAAIGHVLPGNLGRVTKLATLIAGGFMANMMADKVCEYSDGKIDKAAELLQKSEEGPADQAEPETEEP